MGLAEAACKQPVLPLGIAAGCFLLRDAQTRLFGLHAAAGFALAVFTGAKIGANHNYFIEPSWAAMFCLALAMIQWQPRAVYPWVVAAAGVLIVQSAVRMTPHVQSHYERIRQWPQTMLAVQKYGQIGPLLTMQVGAQVLSGQEPCVVDVFILSCLSRRGAFDVSPILDALRDRKFAAVIARDDIRFTAPGDTIWTDAERQLVARCYRPVDRFGDLTVYIPRQTPQSDIPLSPSDEKKWTGIVRRCYEDGRKESEANLVCGRKHGAERFWDGDGCLWREIHYVNGVQHGLETTWYENGRRAGAVEYANGRREGLETTWYETGRKWTETPYLHDAPHGLATRWNPDGSIADQKRWDHGVAR